MIDPCPRRLSGMLFFLCAAAALWLACRSNDSTSQMHPLHQTERARTALQNNLSWFKNSSIMLPNDGRWGVAERIFVPPDQESLSALLQSFNSWTNYKDWTVIEARRPDCNFQTALLFLLARELDLEPSTTAENILEYLYCRSALLTRSHPDTLVGTWNWSNIRKDLYLWFDDHSWNLIVPLIIEQRFPEIAHRFNMRHYAEQLSLCFFEGFNRTLLAGKEGQGDCVDPHGIWQGNIWLPHWGSLACAALAFSWRAGLLTDVPVEAVVQRYHIYLEKNVERFNASECAYAVIGASTCAKVFPKNTLFLTVAETFADRLVAKMDPVYGNIPAEHYEAPIGPHFVDMIYTVNWSLLAFQNLLAVSERPQFQEAYQKLLNLVIDIQDTSSSLAFRGCWRGMYNMQTRSWGGGDRIEGGAGSIYSGWTNAPIGIVLANHLLATSMIE